jgi:hypothetical protein
LKGLIAGIAPFTIGWYIADESASEDSKEYGSRNLPTLLFALTYTPL